jgi:ribosomal-protein-alanine N-acetyltransferase
MSTFPIETQRLRIRPFVMEDWPAVHAYTSDAATMTYIDDGVMTEEQTRQFVSDNVGQDAKQFAVDLLAENRLIGHFSFYPWYAPRIYEIGWVFHPSYHRHGYATEGAQALLRHGFEARNVHRVIATCQPQNPPSRRVMEKLGMQREAHFRECIERPDGTWWDEYLYAILENEWRAMGVG